MVQPRLRRGVFAAIVVVLAVLAVTVPSAGATRRRVLTSSKASLLEVSSDCEGSGQTCCGNMVCPHEGGVCCGSSQHCCPAGSVCKPSAEGEQQMCEVVTDEEEPVETCQCKEQTECSCAPKVRAEAKCPGHPSCDVQESSSVTADVVDSGRTIRLVGPETKAPPTVQNNTLVTPPVNATAEQKRRMLLEAERAALARAKRELEQFEKSAAAKTKLLEEEREKEMAGAKKLAQQEKAEEQRTKERIAEDDAKRKNQTDKLIEEAIQNAVEPVVARLKAEQTEKNKIKDMDEETTKKVERANGLKQKRVEEQLQKDEKQRNLEEKLEDEDRKVADKTAAVGRKVEEQRLKLNAAKEAHEKSGERREEAAKQRKLDDIEIAYESKQTFDTSAKERKRLDKAHEEELKLAANLERTREQQQKAINWAGVEQEKKKIESAESSRKNQKRHDMSSEQATKRSSWANDKAVRDEQREKTVFGDATSEENQKRRRTDELEETRNNEAEQKQEQQKKSDDKRQNEVKGEERAKDKVSAASEAVAKVDEKRVIEERDKHEQTLKFKKRALRR